MQRNNVKGTAILLFASLIWGFAFVVQSDATSVIKPFAFNSARSFLGAIVIGLFLVFRRLKTKAPFFDAEKTNIKGIITAGIICGIFLFGETNFQQLGLQVYPKNCAPEARAGFITALYVILVPVISVFLKKKTSPLVWAAVFISLIGVYLLCLSNGLNGIYSGDILMFFCALSCAFHIHSVDKFGVLIGGVLLSFVQFTVNGILSGAASLIFEPDMTVNNLYLALPQILYMGILSSGLAYTLQIIGQKYAEPSVASLSMSFEGVFAAIGGWLCFGNVLTFKEFAGCALVFIAIIVAQLPEIFAKKNAFSEKKTCQKSQENRP